MLSRHPKITRRLASHASQVPREKRPSLCQGIRSGLLGEECVQVERC